MFPLPELDHLWLLLTSHTLSWALTAFIILLTSWYVLKQWSAQRRRRSKDTLTEEEKDELIEQWTPEPLTPPLDPHHFSLRVRTVSSSYGKMITVDGLECLNLATHDYLGFLENDECLEAAENALRQFGVGSCGPRGFFGTVTVHLDLERTIADFLGAEEAILYSYGYSAISSAIPAYAKQDDIIYADEGVNFAIQQGISAARSTVRYFAHNNYQHLSRLLAQDAAAAATAAAASNRKSKAALEQARFIVVEGLYFNYGDICPLPEIVALKHRYKCRLFVDDSSAFCVLGTGGRGSVSHWKLDMSMDIDLIAASLEMATAAYGGFCAGSHYIIDHQRLSGLGYCYSASLPPLQAAFGLHAIELVNREPERVEKLHENCRLMHRLLAKHADHVAVQGDPVSPIKHLRFALPIEEALARRCSPSDEVITENGSFYQATQRTAAEFDVYRLEKVEKDAHERGYALVVARYLEQLEHAPVRPSIRLAVTAQLTELEMAQAVDVIASAFKNVSSRFQAGLI